MIIRCPACRRFRNVHRWPLTCNCGRVVAESEAVDASGELNHKQRVTDNKRPDRLVAAYRSQCEQCPEYHDRCGMATGGCEESRENLWMHWLRRGACPVGKWGPDVPLFTRPERLAVVVCYFNPCGYQRPRDNYYQFAIGIQSAGVDLWTAELAYDDDPFDLPYAQMRLRGTRARNLLWQKERLLNLLIRKLTPDVDAVAWVDADVLFDEPDWHVKTLDVLANNHVVQLFDTIRYTNRDVEEIGQHRSTGWFYQHEPARHDNLMISHPGFAWAARADWLREHGLYEHMVTGGGDSLMIAGFTAAKMHVFDPITNCWLDHVYGWTNAVYADVGGFLGYVPGTITHLYHGSLGNRKYVERWRYLTDGLYDPATDIEVDQAGLLAWTDFAREAKPGMVRKVTDYFALRREDD